MDDSSDLSKITENLGNLIKNFSVFGNDLSKGLSKMGNMFNNFSDLTDEENLELVNIYKKMSTSDFEVIKKSLVSGDKSKIREVLLKHCSDEKLINSIILSTDIAKEGLNMEQTLMKDLGDIIGMFKTSETKSDLKEESKSEGTKMDETEKSDSIGIFINDILKEQSKKSDESKKESDEIDSIGTVIKDVLKDIGCMDVDMSQVKSILDQVMTKLEQSEGMEGLRETTQKITANLESKMDNKPINNDMISCMEGLRETTKKVVVSLESEMDSNDMISSFEKFLNPKPKIREGLINETATMIQQHKKLSDDINSISKTLTTSEIKALEDRCGELPLDFRLRMMENTIHKLDQKLVETGEKDDLNELKDKIDDIALNIDILLTRLTKFIQ